MAGRAGQRAAVDRVQLADQADLDGSHGQRLHDQLDRHGDPRRREELLGRDQGADGGADAGRRAGRPGDQMVSQRVAGQAVALGHQRDLVPDRDAGGVVDQPLGHELARRDRPGACRPGRVTNLFGQLPEVGEAVVICHHHHVYPLG